MLNTMLKSSLSFFDPDAIRYMGSVTKNGTEADSFNSPEDALDVLSIAGVGDLVVIAFTFNTQVDSTFTWNGMTFTAVSSNTGVSEPGSYVGYRFVQAGDSNPYVTGVTSSLWRGFCVVASVFRNATSFVSSATATGTSGLPNPPSRTATGNLWVVTGHLANDLVTTWVAPTNYNVSGSATGNRSLTERSSTVVAYRIENLTADDPSAFTASSGQDAWRSTTMAFA